MIELDRKTFDEEVLEADGYVFVDYWGQSCEPCKALMPGIEELAEKYADDMKFCKLDTGVARRIAIREKVIGLPTMIIYKDGEQVDDLRGDDDCTLENIEELIKKYV